MTSFFNQLLKELPPELPEIINITDYSSSKISIVRVENAFSEPKAFDIYKFLLPLTNQYPLEIVEDEKYLLKKHNLFPLNPGQFHSCETNNQPIIETPPFLAIFIDKEFVQETGKTLFGSSSVFFENNNFSIINSNLQNLINIFIEETLNQQTGYEFILENLNLQIMINLLRILKSNCSPKISEKNHSSRKAVKYVQEFLQENYQHEFSLEEMATAVNYSPYHFIRIFKAETGKTPFEYLLDIKIAKARELLKKTNKAIAEVCFDSGFNNRSHFSVVFKRKTGYSPTQYRKIVK